MANTFYTSHVSFTDLLMLPSILEAIQREVECLKKIYVYTSPSEAAYLIKWEIEMPDYSFVKEDF